MSFIFRMVGRGVRQDQWFRHSTTSKTLNIIMKVILSASNLPAATVDLFLISSDAGFFVFPDLSVRTEGSYRLKLSLFEVVG